VRAGCAVVVGSVCLLAGVGPEDADASSQSKTAEDTNTSARHKTPDDRLILAITRGVFIIFVVDVCIARR
jgi:hypothetical protein